MTPSRSVLAAYVGLLLLPALPAQESKHEAKRDDLVDKKFLEWARSAFRPVRKPGEFQRTIDLLEGHLRAGRNVALTMDAGLTRTGKSVLGLTWAGEIHAFDLTPAQAKAAGLSANEAFVSNRGRSEADNRFTPPLVRLEQLRFEGGPKVPGNKKIDGTVLCKPAISQPPGTYVLRTCHRIDGKTSAGIQFLDGLPADGVLKVSIGPINEAEGDVSFGPTPVLVDLLLTGSSDGKGWVASNTLAVLLDVQPDLDACARLSLAFMNQIADILASVKDRESGAKALDDYKQIAQRNQALVETMERLSPTKEQNDDIDLRYGPKLDAFAKRLGDELARLEQSDWGRAFLEGAPKGADAK